MSNDIQNIENNNVNTSSKLSSHKNKSCENSSESHFTLLGLSDLVSELNNVSVFLLSGVNSCPLDVIQQLQTYQGELILKIDIYLSTIRAIN